MKNLAFLGVSACTAIIELNCSVTCIQCLLITFQAYKSLCPLFIKLCTIKKDLESLVVNSQRFFIILSVIMESTDAFVDIQIEWIKFYTPGEGLKRFNISFENNERIA